MYKIYYLALFVLVYHFSPVVSFSQEEESTNTMEQTGNDSTSINHESAGNNYYPFVLTADNGKFIITIDIEKDDIYDKYEAVFENHAYSGNGYCWEGMIIQILEKTEPSLLSHIEFNSNDDMFSAIADTEENQIRFAEVLSPIISNIPEFEYFIKRADRKRIDE